MSSALAADRRKAPRSAAASVSTGGATTYHLDTSGVLFVLSGAFVGLDKVVFDRVKQLHNVVVSDGAPSWETVQSELEPQDLHTYGLIPEFVGRLPVIASLGELSEEDLLRVLTEPKNALVTQYETLFAASGVTLKVTTPALRAIARQAASKGTGARGLRRIIEDRLLEAMYSTFGSSSVHYVLLDERAATGEAQVQLFPRGGRHFFWNAYEDEEKGAASATGSGMGIKPPPFVRGETPDLRNKPALAAVLRRKSRVRLARPSRVGNIRIHVD